MLLVLVTQLIQHCERNGRLFGHVAAVRLADLIERLVGFLNIASAPVGTPPGSASLGSETPPTLLKEKKPAGASGYSKSMDKNFLVSGEDGLNTGMKCSPMEFAVAFALMAPVHRILEQHKAKATLDSDAELVTIVDEKLDTLRSGMVHALRIALSPRAYDMLDWKDSRAQAAMAANGNLRAMIGSADPNGEGGEDLLNIGGSLDQLWMKRY